MSKKRFVARAQVIKSGLSVRGFDKPILRTLAVTGKAHLALATVARQRVKFVPAELPLPVRTYELNQGHVLYVAQKVLGLDEVIAGVEITVVLQRERVPAGLGEDAHRRRPADPGSQGRVKHLNEDAAHVPSHPFIENLDQKSPELLRCNRAIRHSVSLLETRDAVLVHPLDDRNELNEARSGLVAQEVFELALMLSPDGAVTALSSVRLA